MPGRPPSDVSAWLDGLGLGAHAELFAANAIDGEVLPELTEADLEKLGLPLGHRKKLLKAIAVLRPAPPAAAPPRAAERRQLTVMFVDLVGSTELSARLDPEELGELLKAYQNAVTGEVTRFEGHAAKLMGDGVLAYFGWPRAHEDEAERAVRAGLAIAGAVSRIEGGGEPLSCRVGIATGLVVVGDLIGEGAAQEEAVVGETPNLAARLQALAGPGQVVIAEATRRLVGEQFELADLGAVALKGLAAPVPAFAVVGERALESRYSARGGRSPVPLVGREQELALLLERWHQGVAGEGQLVLLTGEAGIGKSRIGEALVEAVAGEPHYRVRYQCSPYHTDSALWPTIQQLTRAAGLAAHDPLEVKLDRLEALVGPAARDDRETLALLAMLLGLDGSGRYGELRLSPQQRRNRTLACLIAQLTALARQKPVLWLVEDAHWIDPTTLELIGLALDRIAQERVLALVTARPGFSDGLGGHPIVTRLALNRLGRPGVEAIVERITGAKRVPEALLDEIVTRTDGVPLYIEEITKAVIESGALRETADAWVLDRPLAHLAIPASLHDSLMARLDRLQPVKEVAQTAAVIGREFDHRLLAALAPLPQPELDRALDRLVEAELVFRRGATPEATYLFKHALVRDAAYESLLKSRRQALHARLFDVLEAQGETAPEIVAQHAEAAGLVEKALEYWELAGAQATARSAYKEAIAHFGAAIRLCRQIGNDERWQRCELRLQVQLGQPAIAHLGYQAPMTMAAFDRACELAEALSDRPLLSQAVFGQWAGKYIGGAPAAALARRFVELTNADPAHLPLCVGLRMVSLEQFHEGKFKAARDFAADSVAIYDPAADCALCHRYATDPRVNAAAYKGWSLWHLGYPDEAAAMAEQALCWARELDHIPTTILALVHGFGLINVWLRDAERVETAAREALRLCEAMSLAMWHAWGRSRLGWALAQGSLAEGIDEMEAALREARDIGVGRLEGYHLGLLAESLSKAGRRAEAKARIAEAFVAHDRSGDLAFTAELHRLRAAIALRASAAGTLEAETDLLRALEVAREQEARSLQLRAARDLAALWAAGAERRKALDLLAPIYAWFTEGLDTRDLIEAKALLDALA